MSVRIPRFFWLPSVLGVVATLSGCLDLGDSINNLIKDKPNFAHTKKAILFLKEAGATAADSYQLSIVDYDEEFDKSANGNVFIVDGDHGNAWLNPKCIELAWKANDTLLIIYDKKLRTFLQEKAIDGVTIVYQHK
jgi:hypothetical protein